METRPASHPPADVLLALGAGKLDDATADAIFFHVEVCPDCLKTAGRLTGDSFLDKLRAARGYSGTPAPSKVLSSFPAAGYTAPIPTTSERPGLTILPELRDHPQYEVLRELGRGGMGVVYLAKNKLMDRLEVLKVVNKQLLGDAGAAERFLREIRSAAQLNHPNIVTAYSALQAGDVLLFSMEYIEGRDLAQVVKARGPLPAAHSGSYVLQAARGLQHAFEKGMVHRDIKPQNLILDGKKNIVKILDFGLAKATRTTAGIPGEGLTGMNMMMGTPDYMAPEQARDAANVDIRADVYSLGCTLYCLLAGRAPFVGGSLATKIAAHQLSEPEPVESLRTDLPPGLAGIVRKMMAKDPAQRYQKPEEVVQALTVCFKGKGKKPTAKALPVNVRTAMPVGIPKAGPKEEAQVIHWETIVATPAARLQTMRQYPSPLGRLKNELLTQMRKRWLMGVGGAAAALMLMGLIGLWAVGVFRVKTASGVLFVQVNEPNAEVFVDGERMTVSWNNGGTKAEIHVKPGTRKVEVKKDGFSVAGKELTFKDGNTEVFTARLLPAPRVAKADRPPLDTKKPDTPPVAGAADDDKGFTPLFNGKDLTGWEPVSDHVTWSFEKGELIGRSDGRWGFLDTTKSDYANFHLRMETMLTDGDGAGLSFRAGPPNGGGVAVVGNSGASYIANIGNIPEGQSSVGTQKTGTLFIGYGVPGPGKPALEVAKDVSLKEGEWFSLEVIATSNRIRVLVKGQTVVDYTDGNYTFMRGKLRILKRGGTTELILRMVRTETFPKRLVSL
jgi:serine/threonine protein kinase